MSGAPDVAIVAPFPPIDGSHHAGSSGVASYTANLARALRASGAEVTVVAPRDDDDTDRVEVDHHGVRVHRCFRLDRRGVVDVAGAAADIGAPLVHVQFELFLYGGPQGVAGVLGGLGRLHRRGVPTVVTMHQTVQPAVVDRGYTQLHRVPVPAPVARAGIGALQRAVERAATRTVVHEEPFRDVIRGATVIPHGIERIRPLDRAPARERLGLGDEFVALCFGFVSPYKGLELALDAGELAGDDALVVVAGDDHPRLAVAGDDYAHELRRRYDGSARFTGWVPGDEVVPWFSAADVAVFPYPQPFSSSGALALALACRTPVLTSKPLGRCIGAPSDLTFADAHVLADLLRNLAADPAALRGLREWTACLADGRRWDDVAARHRRLYQEVAA